MVVSSTFSSTSTTTSSSSRSKTNTIGGAQHSQPSWQRTVGGICEATKWIVEPLIAFVGGGSSNNDSSRKRKPTTIQICRVGLGRTGTTSLDAALELLGYTPLRDNDIAYVTDLFADLYDTTTTSNDDNEKDDDGTTTTIQGKDDNDDDKARQEQRRMEMFVRQLGRRGYDAMYWYGDVYYRWAAKAAHRGDVKVIYTVRDTPQQWATSYVETDVASFPLLFQYKPFTFFTTVQNMNNGALDEVLRTHSGNDSSKYNDVDHLTHVYQDADAKIHNVFANVGRANFLEFNVKDGWEPLCQFLNKPPPPDGIPFPHVNDRVVMKAMMTTFWTITYVWPLLTVLLVVPFIWIGRRLLVFFLSAIARLWRPDNDNDDDMKKNK